jgi:hypothetical protein
MSSRKQTPSRKIIFKAKAVAAHLRKLRAEANPESWWKSAIKFDWTTEPRKGANGTQWISITYTDEQGVTGRLNLRIIGERHTGQIMPNTDAGVSELAGRSKATIEKRAKQPTIQIQKWSVPVKTAADGITPLSGEDGSPVLPGDDKLSSYYTIADALNEAFAGEVRERVDRGIAFVAGIQKAKLADKTATAPAILEAHFAGAPRSFGDIILAADSVSAIRRVAPKEADALIKGAIITTNVKIVSLTQEFISSSAMKNAGMPLPNPMTRITMKFDQLTGVAQTSFYDKDAPFMEGGAQRYDVGKVDGEPVNADNIHLFIPPGSIVDAMISIDVCLSNMGISMPVKVETVVVAKPMTKSSGLDDLYGDDDEDDDGREIGAAAVGAPARGPAAAVGFDEGLLSELGGN